jgi:hydroxymethylbilane synthase
MTLRLGSSLPLGVGQGETLLIATMDEMQRSFKIGTRGSKLALAQAHELQQRLAVAQGWPADELSTRLPVMPITTTGDVLKDRPLNEAGGKGLFTKEIDEALLGGRVDLAVHSLKDLPSRLPAGLEIVAVLPREDPRDAFISRLANRIADLPQGAVVGSTSLRRQAQILLARPDLRVVTFRGNVDTRLKKLEAGEVSATLLAVAGLKRIGLADHITSILEPTEMLPCVAQGAIGIMARSADSEAKTLLAAVDHRPSHLCVLVERAFLELLDGSCRTPIAGLATLSGDAIAFRGAIFAPDGSFREDVQCRVAPPLTLKRLKAEGADAAQELLDRPRGQSILKGL